MHELTTGRRVFLDKSRPPRSRRRHHRPAELQARDGTSTVNSGVVRASAPAVTRQHVDDARPAQSSQPMYKQITSTMSARGDPSFQATHEACVISPNSSSSSRCRQHRHPQRHHGEPIVSQSPGLFPSTTISFTPDAGYGVGRRVNAIRHARSSRAAARLPGHRSQGTPHAYQSASGGEVC